jgi:cysteine synthase
MPENVSVERKRILFAFGANIIYNRRTMVPTARSVARKM